jgi:hypothetical protein
MNALAIDGSILVFPRDIALDSAIEMSELRNWGVSLRLLVAGTEPVDTAMAIRRSRPCLDRALPSSITSPAAGARGDENTALAAAEPTELHAQWQSNSIR